MVGDDLSVLIVDLVKIDRHVEVFIIRQRLGTDHDTLTRDLFGHHLIAVLEWKKELDLHLCHRFKIMIHRAISP